MMGRTRTEKGREQDDGTAAGQGRDRDRWEWERDGELVRDGEGTKNGTETERKRNGTETERNGSVPERSETERRRNGMGCSETGGATDGNVMGKERRYRHDTRREKERYQTKKNTGRHRITQNRLGQLGTGARVNGTGSSYTRAAS